MTDCRDCHRRYPTGERGGHCTTCHQSFSSDRVFDRHRVGKFEPMERRCLTPDEMTAKGYVQRQHGYWGEPGTPPPHTTPSDSGSRPLSNER